MRSVKHLRMLMERFPTVMQLARELRDVMDRRAPSVTSPWGFTLAGHEQMAAGLFEPVETKIVRNLLQHVELLVNVGANVGYYCCHALSMGKPVIAVEPVQRNLHYLMRNIVENGWNRNVQIFPVAAGAQADVMTIWGGGTGASLIKGWASIPKSYATRVPVLPLDRILGEELEGRKALILVDVEGAEHMVLKGASNTLKDESQPIWMVEIAAREHQPEGVGFNPNFEQCFEAFFAAGYQACTATQDPLCMDPERVQRIVKGEEEVPTHNYLFYSPADSGIIEHCLSS